MHAIFWLENQKRRDYFVDMGVEGKVTLQWILGKYGWRVSIGFIWFRIGTNGGLL